jgi:cephalosporin-C deacetylase
MKPLLVLIIAAFSLAPAFAQALVVTAARPGGVYRLGEKIVWHITVDASGGAPVEKVQYSVKAGNLTEMAHGELTLIGGTADLATSLNTPGVVFAKFSVVVPGKPPLRVDAGALVAPEGITPSSPRPADFDRFWQTKIAEINAIPAHPVLTPAESGKPGVDYDKITLDGIRGTKIQGQLAWPSVGGKHPALLIVQWAGVYPLVREWATGPAASGWLVLNINAHDLPIDATPAFYAEQSRHALANYPAIGSDDREKSYFLRMYLACYRAAEYLAHREDWDGRTLVVQGTSQGGLQAIVTGALYPKVTAILVNVPAGSDQTGAEVGRQSGWPNWNHPMPGKDPVKVRETGRYYDAVNFASRITCPALVAIGLIDETSAPAGVVASFNQMKGPKELVVMEHSDHHGQHNTQAAYYARSNAWLRRLATGAAPPVQKLPGDN